MNKRKKHRNSGKGLHLLKPPKNLQLRESPGGPQSSTLGLSHRPEESDDSSGPTVSAEPSRQEPGPKASSCSSEDTGAASDLEPPEKKPVPFPPSQNSVRRFVPQFAKPKKTVARKAETWEEDLESGAVSWETSPELGIYHADSQLQEDALRLLLHKAGRPADQTWVDGACPEQSSQSPVMAVSGSGHSQPKVTPEVGTGPSDSGRANKNTWIGTTPPDMGSLGNNSPEVQRAWVPDSCGQERHPPNGDDKERELNSRAPQEGGTQGGGAESQQSRESQEGQGIPYTQVSAPALDPAGLCLKTWSVTQDLPVPTQTLSGTGVKAAPGHSSPENTSLGDSVIIDVSSDPSWLKQKAMEVARPLLSLSKPAPSRDCSRALLGYIPLAGESTKSPEEASLEDGSCGDVAVGLAAIPAVTPGKQEPMGDTKEPGHQALEMVLGVETEDPSPDGQWLGGRRILASQAQPMDQKTVELGSQSHQQDLEGLSLPSSTSLLEYSCVASGFPQGTGACHSSPGFPKEPTGQSPPTLNPTDQGSWQESSAMELDFLPDSQIQDVLNTPDLEALPEQGFPAENVPGVDWPGHSLCAIGEDLMGVAKAQPRLLLGTQTQDEVCQMQDATDTVRGLVVELSNLNRLIMSTHRDLEAFKRRKTRPLSYPTKGPRNLALG